MTKDEFIERCQEAVDLCGENLHRVVGGMTAHFTISVAKLEGTGMPIIERIPEGLAEMYIALMMIRLKYEITEEEVDDAIEERLTKV